LHVTVATEARFALGPDGIVRSDTGGRAHAFWSRYLEVFDTVTVLARVTKVQHASGYEVTGPGVCVRPLPGSRGLRGVVATAWPGSGDVTKGNQGSSMAYIARVPGLVGARLIRAANRQHRPYALEVVGDPYDVLRADVVRAGLAPIIRRLGLRQLRRQCAMSAAVAYVTREQLQKRYPAPRAQHVTHYSSVDLPDEAFVAAPRLAAESTLRIVTVGTQSQRYKGHDLLIEAVAQLRDSRHHVELRIVGDGRYRTELENLAASRGLKDLVQFVGRLPSGAAVREELDRADLFVLASRTEGLPRALIEAMARGLPCVASRVGGIPELLADEDMVASGDVPALVSLIGRLSRDPDRRDAMARRNLDAAREYREEVLELRRRTFYRAVAELSTTHGQDQHDTHGGTDL
jgi:phosphatidyl-myo-inositol dimannoside synthase